MERAYATERPAQKAATHAARHKKPAQHPILRLQRAVGNRAVNEMLQFSDADGDILLAVEALLRNLVQGKADYPKVYGEHFPHSALDILQDLVFAYTVPFDPLVTARRFERLSRARAAIRPIVARLIHSDPAGEAFARESIEGPMDFLERRIHSRFEEAERRKHSAEATARATMEADEENASLWLAPWEVEQMRLVVGETKGLINDVSGLVAAQSAEKPDPAVQTARTGAKMVQAEVTKFNREKGPDLGKGWTAIQGVRGKAPNDALVNLALMSHLKAVIDIADQVLVLSDGPQRRKLIKDLKALVHPSTATLDQALTGMQTLGVAVEASITLTTGALLAVSGGKALIAGAGISSMVANAGRTIVGTGFWVSGAKITGMLNVIGAVRGIVKAAQKGATLDDRLAAARDGLSSLVGAIRYVQIPFRGPIQATYAGAAGGATRLIWEAWIVSKVFSWQGEEVAKGVSGLIAWDVNRSFDVLRRNGMDLERQMDIALNLATTEARHPGDSLQSEGYHEAYIASLAELRKVMRRAYGQALWDNGTASPGHYPSVREAFRSVDGGAVARGLAPNALPDEILLAAMSLLGGLRQAWSTYDHARSDAMKAPR